MNTHHTVFSLLLGITTLMPAASVHADAATTADQEQRLVEAVRANDRQALGRNAAPMVAGDIIRSIPAPGSDTVGLAWDGKHLWDMDDYYKGPSLYRLEVVDGAVLRSYSPPAENPKGLAYDGQVLWNVDFITDRIYRIDPLTGAVLGSIPAPTGITSGLAWDGNALWVSEWYSNALYRIDPTNGTVLATLPAPGSQDEYPYGLAWDGKRLWVSKSIALYQIDPVTGATLQSIPAPEVGTYGMTWDGTYLWTGSWIDDTLYQIDAGGSGGVWTEAYQRMFAAPGDLTRLYRYRDEVLARNALGQRYISQLYGESDAVLDTLLAHPELIARARDLIEQHAPAVAQVLAGEQGVIQDSDAVMAFLTDFAAVSPRPLRMLNDRVIQQLQAARRSGTPVFGLLLR